MANYPDNKKDDTDFEDVYAGPEFFGVDDEPKDGLHGEEKKEKKPEPPQDEFVCVYAGPEYFGVKEEDPDTEVEVEPEEDPAAPEPVDEPEQQSGHRYGISFPVRIQTIKQKLPADQFFKDRRADNRVNIQQEPLIFQPFEQLLD